MIILLDVDNTLANNSSRYLLSTKNDGLIDWDILYKYENLLLDTPIKSVIETVRLFYNNGYRIIIFTSRPESTKKATQDWLNYHNVPYNNLYMRSLENHKIKDVDLKLDMYKKYIKDEVFLAIDDNQNIIDLWNSLKITTYKITAS
jgi:uncharacterized HAD superfamily protein